MTKFYEKIPKNLSESGTLSTASHKYIIPMEDTIAIRGARGP
jgi:hypothetical protein